MPNLSSDFALSTALLNGQTATTNGTSAAFTIPQGSSYRLTVELLTASSTVTNFNLSLYTSSDAGTTYHGLLAFTALTTSGQAISMIFRPYMGPGDVATVTGTLPILGSTDFATNTQLVALNAPFSSQFLKARWLAATTGTVTFNLKRDTVRQDLSD